MRGALLCLFLAVAVHAAWGQTAHSLDQVPSLLKTPEAKDAFSQQMVGTPAPDLLGLHLPAALSKKTIITLLLPPNDTAPLNAVGARPWPGQADRYVAIACTGGDLPQGPNDQACAEGQNSDAKPPLAVYVGVIEAKAGTAPGLVAKPAQVNAMVNWSDTALPSAPEALDDATGTLVHPDSFDGFDLAAYQISPTQRAFGLRGSWTDGYSGGMGSYTALYLFAIVDGSIKQILTLPMSAYLDTAGDWHKDGTRSHDITQDANILVVTSHSTDGYFDLLLKSRLKRWQRTYRWSGTARDYQPVGK